MLLFAIVNQHFLSFVFTGSSGLTFTVGELPGSLASIGRSANIYTFFQIYFQFHSASNMKDFPRGLRCNDFHISFFLGQKNENQATKKVC